MSTQIRLVGCDRYNYKGETFLKVDESDAPVIYELDNDKAEVLLEKKDDFDRPYFVKVGGLKIEKADLPKETKRRGRPPGSKNKKPKVLKMGDTAPLKDDIETGSKSDDITGLNDDNDDDPDEGVEV